MMLRVLMWPVLLVVVVAQGCAIDPTARYCAAVDEHERAAIRTLLAARTAPNLILVICAGG